MDFRWKEKEPITLFNEQLAEFDVVKFEVESKKASYVSGLTIICFWFLRFALGKEKTHCTCSVYVVQFG